MTIKTIMAVMKDAQKDRGTLETAFLIGKCLSCHVRVFHVLPDPTTTVPVIGEAMSAALVEEIISVATKRNEEEAGAIRLLFDQYCSRYGIPVTEEPPGPASMSAAYQEESGEADILVTQRGRLADFLVIGQPGEDSDGTRQALLNAALRGSGRAVLVVPTGAIEHFCDHVAIAWKGTAESARAVTAALPLLLKAQDVTILVAEEDNSLASADDLETHLAWHGITSSVKRIVPQGTLPGGSVIGDALLGSCAEMKIDLLVMGAYTRSRLQRLILGGVTRHILENATIPIVLSH